MASLWNKHIYKYNLSMLNEIDHFPTELLDCAATELYHHLPGPTLIHLPGRRHKPLFVSILLHGNEITGLLAVQTIIKRHSNRGLPRALSIFLGNISAARENIRRQDEQPDYNRIWPGATASLLNTPEAEMMQRIVNIMSTRNVFASVDIHNNTGLNPHYACVNVLDHRYLQLATLFSRTVVYFTRPLGVQSMAFAQLCPAVTLECGRPGEHRGLQHTIEYLKACLNLSQLPTHPVAEHDIDLFHTVAQVKIHEDVSFSFKQTEVDIILDEDIDHLNFRELPEGTCLGTVQTPDKMILSAMNEQGKDVTRYYLKTMDNRIVLARPVMPSMLTLDERVIRQDCFCYFMERLMLDGSLSV